MRWTEIFTEELNPLQIAKGVVMDIVSRLKAQGVGSITVKQVVDLIRNNPDLDGTAVDADLVATAVKGMEGLSVEPDPENGQLSVMISNAGAGRQVDQKQAEKDDKQVKSAALRTIAQKDKE